MPETIEIFWNDLSEEAQLNILKASGYSSSEEFLKDTNYDTLPLTEIVIGS